MKTLLDVIVQQTLSIDSIHTILFEYVYSCSPIITEQTDSVEAATSAKVKRNEKIFVDQTELSVSLQIHNTSGIANDRPNDDDKEEEMQYTI